MKLEIEIDFKKLGEELAKHDFVEVVRCRDCEHWKPMGKHFGECHNGCHDVEFYCRDGERREANEVD